ncbi:hypothetical protein B0H14DRAFT_2560641 [Mycena olivaceomarginata]|nr:hypothetical protein B0H14DRAFT_2560641 [Mycena olivaceomarginata]
MDKYYELRDATTALEDTITARRSALQIANRLDVKHLADLDLDAVRILETGLGRKSWRLCAVSDGDDVAEELVVRIQGILMQNKLVPRNPQSCPRRKVPFMCQYLEICGLSSDSFAISVAKLEEVNQRFTDHFSGVKVVGIAQPAVSLGPALCASNRLFTLKKDAPTEQDNMFAEGLDPVGVLERLKSTELIHAPENMVKYYKDKVRYEGTVPGSFKTGDVVEIQLSFVGIATGQGDIKVTSRLQAVTILDSSFTKAASEARAKAKLDVKGNTAVRRKVGYFFEDEEEPLRASKKRQAQMVVE